MTLQAADQFHIGIVVDDFESTLTELTDLFDYTWCEEMSNPVDVRYGDGSTDVVRTSFVYSMSVPRLEIIRANPGTLWVPASSGVHHLGYWSDDVERDADALVRQGFATEVTGLRPDGAPFWAYHRNASGLRIELVAAALQPVMEEYFTTGKIPTGIKAAPVDDAASGEQGPTP